MFGDIAMSPEPTGLNLNTNPSRPTTADSSLHSYTMQTTRRARSASTSSSATNFPSSYDAFGLAASPSAHSPKHSYLATRPLAFPPQWTNGGTGMLPMPLGSSPMGTSMPGSPMTYLAPSTDLTMPSPSQHAQSHGVLPSASLMGGSSMRLNRPSLLSLQTSVEEEDSRDTDSDDKRAHSTIAEELSEELDPETDMDGNAADFVKRWRNRLEPSPTIRRVQSACGTPRQSSVSPFAMSATNDIASGSGSGSVSPTARLPMALRRASSEDQSAGPRPDFKLMLDGMRRDGSGLGDSARGNGMERSTMKHKDKGKGKEKMSFSSGGSSASRDGEGSRRPQSMLEGKRVSARLPPNLRATLAAEKDIAGQEIRSEALLQRLILTNPSSLPITPRPSRYHRNRAMSTFSSALSQTSDSMSDDSSDDEGPFTADDLIERETTPAIEPGWSAGMEVDMTTPGATTGSTGTSHDTPGQVGMMPLQSDFGFATRRGPSGRSSMNSLNSFGGMKVDEREGGVGHSMTWRESPSAATRTNKRKATFEDSRYEPYGKRLRGSPSDANPSNGGMTPNTGLSHSPLQWQNTLPTVPMSPMSSSGMDYDSASGRSYSRPRSRAGSPGLISGMQMQMMTRPSASPATSSPLNSNGPTSGNPISSLGFGGTNALAGPSGHTQTHAHAHARPMVGMGGLGMLLLSKRNANSISTGMGLVGKNGGLGMEGDGDAAVAERMGGMDFAGDGTQGEGNETGGGRRGSGSDDDEDKMMFD